MRSLRNLLAVVLTALLVTGCEAGFATEPAFTQDKTGAAVADSTPEAAAEEPMQLPPTWTTTPLPTGDPQTETPPPAQPSATRAPIQALGTFTPVPADVVTPVSVDQNWTGWKWIESTTTKLRVPESYDVFDLGQGMGELMVAMLEGLMEGFGETFQGLEELSAEELEIEPTQIGFSAEELKGAFDFDFLIAFEDDFITSVVLASEPSNLPLEFAMQQSLQNIEGDFRVLSRQVIEGANYEMGRFIIEVRDPELDRDGRQLLYVIIHEGQAYTLGYQTLKSKFETQLPIFEKSASTFTIK